MLHRFVYPAIMAALLAVGCSKSEDSKASAAGSPGAAAAAPDAKAASSKDMEARLTKAGWKIASSEDNGEDWPSTYMKIEQGDDDHYKSAQVWIDALGESMEGKPKPHIEMGKGALIRFGWDPSDAKKAAPDLAGFAKDIVAATPPEKATDELFNSQKYDDAVKKWKMTGPSNSPGGRLSPTGVVYNHRSPGADGGTVHIETVHFVKPLADGDIRLVGATIIGVLSDDAATKKAIFAILGG